ncbi:MAG TPA: maleylpyruvate isomerase family mycothiol-dependent enzyme [Acidimicrobiales bacterium]|nr:maleylpyruvate isomerase family mycothiol-dependent enzyme [Acidimicrobiales bacterium]
MSTLDRPGTPSDPLGDYAEVRDRIAGFVSDADGARPVPACPGWQVRDVLVHLLGVCEDWVNQRLEGYASDEWTDDHLRRHASRSPRDLLTAWAECLERFSDLVTSPFGGTPARWAFGDAVVHEADLRGALDAGRVPHDVARLALRGSTARTYDLFRALAGRRSREQVRAWAWSRDPEPVIGAGLPYPFRWSIESIDD